jgi:hypothetical protein
MRAKPGSARANVAAGESRSEGQACACSVTRWVRTRPLLGAQEAGGIDGEDRRAGT